MNLSATPSRRCAPLLRVIFLFAAICALGGRSPAAEKPNVLFILTDDQGWGDARFAGHPYIKTPNLDRFASQATWFKQFYVAATVCSPSRCAFMTSHFPARHNIHGHFADHALNASRHMPDAYGIDDVRAMVCRDPGWTEPAKTFWAKSTTAIVDEAIRFITANQDRTANFKK